MKKPSRLLLLSPLLVLSVLVAACGGKIAPDPNAEPEPAPTSAGRPTPPEPSEPVPLPASGLARASVEETCRFVCDRNARCGAWKYDCLEECVAEHASSCSAQVTAFVSCWARTMDEGCAQLDPACEQAYCAYSRCTGRPLDSYCK